LPVWRYDIQPRWFPERNKGVNNEISSFEELSLLMQNFLAISKIDDGVNGEFGAVVRFLVVDFGIRGRHDYKNKWEERETCAARPHSSEWLR
jgi:hypothetical protein